MNYSIIFTLQILTTWAVCKENNCTLLPCMTELVPLNRREWPKFDFDFYHQTSSSSSSSSSFSPQQISQHSLSDNSSTLNKLQPTSSEIKGDHNEINNNKDNHNYDEKNLIHNYNNSKSCQNRSIDDEMLKRLDWLKQSYLLRSVFQIKSPQVLSKHNQTEHFRRKLLRIYRMAFDRQNTHEKIVNRNRIKLIKRASSSATDVNLTIWDIQTSKNDLEMDVIYFVTRINVPVPFDDAVKLLTFVDNDIIENITGYVVLHKVLKYNHDRHKAIPFMLSSITWKWLFILCAILFLILIIIICVWICCKKNKNHDSIETLHHEISRLSRSRSNRDSKHSARLKDSSHQNLGLETSDSETETSPPPLPKLPPPPSLHRTDVGSQANFEPIYSKPFILTPISRNLSSLSNKTDAYPIDLNTDYDKISYIKTRETIEEKRKPPNFVEVQMSKETQSIVKEIRNELNKYNIKKILDDAPIETSEA